MQDIRRLLFFLILETKYRKHNKSEPQLTQTGSSELSELMERNLRLVIKTVRHALLSLSRWMRPGEH